MSREAFRERFMARIYDPAFRTEDDALARLEAIAWDAHSDARKSPVSRKAGSGFADPSSCMIEALPGQRVEKGDELGFFQYGGSTCCVVFEPDVIRGFIP